MILGPNARDFFIGFRIIYYSLMALNSDSDDTESSGENWAV